MGWFISKQEQADWDKNGTPFEKEVAREQGKTVDQLRRDGRERADEMRRNDSGRRR